MHACHVGGTDEQRAEAFVQFLRRGVSKGQRLYCVVDKAEGRGVADAVRDELPAVRVRWADRLYLRDGAFQPAEVLASHRDAVSAALADGCTGVRVAAHVGWLQEASPAQRQQFVDYEARVNQEFADDVFAALCHIDGAGLPPSFARAVRVAHPLHVEAGDASVLWSGACRMHRMTHGWLAVRGEIDVANSGHLPVMIEELAPPDGAAHLDASALEFIDVSGMRALLRATQRLGPDRRLIVHHASAMMRTVADLAGWSRHAGPIFADS